MVKKTQTVNAVSATPKSSKSKSKSSKETKVSTVLETKTPDLVTEPVNKNVKERKKVQKGKTSTVVDTPVEVSTVETGSDLVEKKKRVIYTSENVLLEFDNIVAFIETEIVRLRESSSKSKGVKFLRTIGKKIKVLRTSSTRVMKKTTTTVRKNNTNSGFLKAVIISPEMIKFTGWPPGERSRVDVTKHICKYIKDNNLQNPVDRRQILADEKLATLLKYDSKTAPDPLTYYRLQTYLKHHFKKVETA